VDKDNGEGDEYGMTTSFLISKSGIIKLLSGDGANSSV
jgi:hypothetical protein